jgi:hypothetical protein
MCNVGYSIGFAEQLISVLTAHCDVIQQHRLDCYLQAVHSWLPKITAFCNIRQAGAGAENGGAGADVGGGMNGVGGGMSTSTHSSMRNSAGGMSSSSNSNTAGNNDSANTTDRATLKRHTMLVKHAMALLQRNAVQLFADWIKEAKAIVEVYEISSGDTAAVSLSQISKFCNKLSLGMEKLAGVANNKCTYDSSSNTLSYVHARRQSVAGATSGAESPSNNGSTGNTVDCIYDDISPVMDDTRDAGVTGMICLHLRCWCMSATLIYYFFVFEKIFFSSRRSATASASAADGTSLEHANQSYAPTK